MDCIACRKQISAESKFCCHCGTKRTEDQKEKTSHSVEPPAKPKKKISAWHYGPLVYFVYGIVFNKGYFRRDKIFGDPFFIWLSVGIIIFGSIRISQLINF